MRFGQRVGVAFFNRQLGEVLELASQWSLLALVDVDVLAIDDCLPGAPTLHGRALAVGLAPVTDAPGHRTDLAAFLELRLPPPWHVTLDADRVRVAHRPAGGPA